MDNIELSTDVSPQARLQASRRALAAQLERRRRPPLPAQDPALARQQGMLARMRRAARVWWYSHPAHDAVDFARPALQDFAERKPYRLVGMAAGAGAALTVLRVWHLLPLTGVALALMKTSDLKATVRSFAAAPQNGVSNPREEDLPQAHTTGALGSRAGAP